MKNGSLNNLRLELKSATPKKIWTKLEIEVISVLSGITPGYEGGFPPGSFTRADIS